MVQIKCCTRKERIDCGNFNIWKDTMAKLLLSLFKLITFHEYMIDLKKESCIIHLENYELKNRL